MSGLTQVYDSDSLYGPGIGVPRMIRWTRAEQLGLNPPEEVSNTVVTAHTKLTIYRSVKSSSMTM